MFSLDSLPFLGRFKAAAGGTPTNPIKRYEMLRHTLYYQFPKMHFTEEMTPHQIHWGVQEALEDQGVANIKSFQPHIKNFWSKVPPGENGKDKNISDYSSFDGGLQGDKGEPIPVWLKIALWVLPFLAIPTMGIAGLVWIGLAYYSWYWKTFKVGQVSLYYRGIYQLPEDKNPTGWRFSVDIMFSVDVKKPVGLPIVQPIYDVLTQNLMGQLNPRSVTKSLPEMISMKPEEFETRFPVTVQEVDSDNS